MNIKVNKQSTNPVCTINLKAYAVSTDTNDNPIGWYKHILEGYLFYRSSDGHLVVFSEKRQNPTFFFIGGSFQAEYLGRMSLTSIVIGEEDTKNIEVTTNNFGVPELETIPIDIALYNAVWGTVGVSGRDPLKYVRLIDCSTEHLKNILKTEYLTKDSGTRILIDKILTMRKV